MEYLALFTTTTAAVKFRRKLQKEGLLSESIPVPRKLSSSCGIAIRFANIEHLRSLVGEGVEKIYSLQGDNYHLLYDAEAEIKDV